MRFKGFFVGKLRKLLLLAIDCSCFAVLAGIYYLANRIFEPHLQYSTSNYIANSGILLLSILAVRLAFGVYNNVVRYTRTLNYFKMIIADVIGACIAVLFVYLCGLYEGIWMFLIITAVNSLMTLFSRFSYRLLYKISNNASNDEVKHINVAIVGAGQLGAYLVNELRSNPSSVYKPIMFIDKDPEKTGNRIAGLKIYPESDDIFKTLEKYNISEIFIAIAAIDNDEAMKLFEFYSRSSCKLKIYDSAVKSFNADDSNSEKPKKHTIRNFEIDDLLFRKPLNVGNTETTDYYKGKTVLITGGGGSIGSELCRQIASCSPKRLVILDIYENNAYDIQQELLRKYGSDIDLFVEIASVRDRDRLNCIFEAYKPDIVFHAAAHKHVPLMEHSACEAIKNNVFGTYNTADMAEKHGVQKFILISTDKAVNPTNVMGASKRLCEMVIQCRTDSKTSFAAVRFGNVLGSNGSVIPLFKQQIEQGGPITITDKRIIRYFMTIPEASQLVMQAGAMAKKGELFVLDMGKPIRIYDLAINMIKLSGLKPGVDIQIKEIGLRPGEKLYEELLIKSETLTKTDNHMIFIEKDAPVERAEMEARLRLLGKAVDESKDSLSSDIIKQALRNVVDTYSDPDTINKNAERSKEMAEANA